MGSYFFGKDMKKLLVLALLVFGFPAFAAQPAGHLIDLKGEVSVTTGGQAGPGQFKQALFVGDVVETKKSGTAKILFLDDTLLALKENSKVQISAFLFDAKAKKRQTVIEGFFGKIRAVVGKFLGEDQPVQIKTPTAVAGIRGSDVGADIRPRSTSFYCFDGSWDAYNTRFPDRKILLNKGFSIEIFKNTAALQENVVPIPADVEERMFNLSWLPSQEEKKEETKGVGEKLVEQTRETFAKQETGKESKEGESTAATGEETAMNSSQEANLEQTQATQSTNMEQTQTGTQPLPGAAAQSTPTTTIRITFP